MLLAAEGGLAHHGAAIAAQAVRQHVVVGRQMQQRRPGRGGQVWEQLRQLAGRGSVGLAEDKIESDGGRAQSGQAFK